MDVEEMVKDGVGAKQAIQEKDPEDETPEQREVRIEDIARNKGWVPRDEWKKSPDEWVDAPEYVERQWDIVDSFRKTNKNLSRQMDHMARQIGDLMKRTDHAAEAKTTETIASLKEQRRNSIQEGDEDAVNRFDDLIEAEKERIRAMRSAPQPQIEDPLVAEWKANNPWYGSDEELTVMANNVADKHKNASWETVLELIDSKIALHLQHQAGNGNGNGQGKAKPKSRVPDVSSGRSASRSDESYDLSGRSDRRTIEEVAERMEQNGGMSKKDYIKDFLKREKQNAR